MFSARNCVIENCHLDLRRHWEEHHNLKKEDLTCDEVLWMHQHDITGECPTIKLRKLAKTKKLTPKTLRRKKMSQVTGTGKRKGPKFSKEELRKGTLLMFSSLKTEEHERL